MKKRILAIIAIAVLAIVLCASIVACDKANEIEYSVTVRLPDKKPLANVTVNWLSGGKVAGTAKTDENGQASVTLAAGTYKVELDDYGEAYTYTSFSLSAQMPGAIIPLSLKQVNYTVTVKDKTGAPAKDVTVTFMSGTKIVGGAKTDENGQATSALDYGEYVVTVSNLPEGNLSDGNKTVTGANPAAEFNLRDSSNTVIKEYKIVVKSEGGLLFKKQAVIVYDGDGYLLVAGETNDNGEYVFSYEAANYTVYVDEVPEGYSPAESSLTADVTETAVILKSEVIKTAPAADTTYVIGDIFHDYSFTTPYNMADGKPWSSSIAEVLKTKKAIILNNWGLNCSWCLTEMPDMQRLYEEYSDKIEIIAVNNFSRVPDSNDNIINYQKNNGITFPMMRDTHSFSDKFGITGWPYTIVIDRYGAIARIEAGAITSYEAWERMILRYIGDDYVQTFIPGDKVSDSINSEISKPDVEVPEDHYTTLIPGAFHNTETFPTNTTITWSPYNNEYAWPFMIGNDSAISSEGEYLYASNTGKPNSLAVIFADVTLPAGKVLTFDYYADTEEGDVMTFVWDGKIVKEIFGKSNGWKTCYLYSDLIDGDYRLQITFGKDGSGNTDVDNVYLRNLRFVDVSELNDSDEDINMLRGAAYGQLTENSTRFPHYADVAIASDGYYHVNLSSLQNSALAGNDESPLLLLNVMGKTYWSPAYSLSELVTGRSVDDPDQYAYSCVFSLNGEPARDYRAELVRYFTAANASDVEGYIPVDKRLHDMIVAFMANVSEYDSHDKEWLEVCFFYSHYGSGTPIGNPIVGLMPETAIEVTTDTVYTANLTHNMYPFPTLIYQFTPDKTALYKIQSLIDSTDTNRAAQIWLYDDNTINSTPLAYSGEDRITIDRVNEQNFVLYYTMEANHTYYIELSFTMQDRGTYDFVITEQTEDVTVLEPTSSRDVFVPAYDENGRPITVPNENGEQIQVYRLADAIDYVKDDEGYYHVKNADGTIGDYIYLDVDNCNTMILGDASIRERIDMYLNDPLIGEDGTINYLDYKIFDFRYCVMYYNYKDANGEEYDTYTPKVDLSATDAKYSDYTEIMRGYVNSAATEGEMKGLVKVNDEIVKILSLYIELRANGVWIKEFSGDQVTEWNIEAAYENEWLRFCWYFNTYKAVSAENE